jgi:hypothetical protein
MVCIDMLGYLDALASLEVFISAGGYSSPPIEMLFREDFVLATIVYPKNAVVRQGSRNMFVRQGQGKPYRYFSRLTSARQYFETRATSPGMPTSREQM